MDVRLQLRKEGGLEGFELTDDDAIKAIAKVIDDRSISF